MTNLHGLSSSFNICAGLWFYQVSLTLQDSHESGRPLLCLLVGTRTCVYRCACILDAGTWTLRLESQKKSSVKLPGAQRHGWVTSQKPQGRGSRAETQVKPEKDRKPAERGLWNQQSAGFPGLFASWSRRDTASLVWSPYGPVSFIDCLSNRSWSLAVVTTGHEAA